MLVIKLLKILIIATAYIRCFSKLMSQGARKDEANEGFGYRYDDEVKTLVNNTGNILNYEINGTNCPGFKKQKTVGFKPLAGLFNQFKYLPLKYMGNLTIELELVNNDTDCFINPDDNTDDNNIGNRFTTDVTLPAGNASNNSKVFVHYSDAISCKL